MRDKRLEQIRKIATRNKIENIFDQIPCLSEFVEITERRNLFIHTDGIVTDEYLRVCKKHSCSLPSGVVLGARVSLDHQYLNRAFAVLFEVGLFFGQIIWRKVLPKSLEAADGSLNEMGYQMLLERKYDLAKAIFGFACNSLPKHHDDAIDKMLRINYASAFRLLGDLEGAKEILGTVDWSSAAMDFKLAVAVTNEDYPLAASLVRKIGKRGDLISRRSYHEWPLFRKFRETKDFREAYKSVYGEKFVATPKMKKRASGVSGGVEKYLDELKSSLEAFRPKPTDTVQIGPGGVMFKIKNQKKGAKPSASQRVARPKLISK